MTSRSVHLFWIISADVLYSMMTPQVICMFFLPQWVNKYGACCGFVLGLLLRTLVGEPLIGLPDMLPLPWDKIQGEGHRYHLFPFRTGIMLINTGIILLISQLTQRLSLSEKSFLKTDCHIHYVAAVESDVEDNETLSKEQPH